MADVSITMVETEALVPPPSVANLLVDEDSDLTDQESSDDEEDQDKAPPPNPVLKRKRAIGPASEKTFLLEGLFSPGSRSSINLGMPVHVVADGGNRAASKERSPSREEPNDKDEAAPSPNAADIETETVPDRPRLRSRASLPAADASRSTGTPSSASPSFTSLPSRPSLRPRTVSLPTAVAKKALVAPIRPPPVITHDTVFKFPLPAHFGLDMLLLDRPFQLTHDIIWEWENENLGIKKIPAPFKAIPRNRFPERAKDLAQKAICECKPPSRFSKEIPCGDKCLNRMMQYLCHPSSCPNGERCSNKSLHRRQPAKLKVFWTGNRGFGLKAVNFIPSGSFVIDYRGDIITIPTYYDRIANEYKGKNDHYALEYGEGEVIDAGMQGSISRFINHGCATNLEVRKFTTLGEGVEEYEVGFWSTRDIDPGEELFYDYNFDSFSNRPSNKDATSAAARDEDEVEGGGRQRCCCGASVCTGWIGGAKADSKVKAKKGKVVITQAGKRKAPTSTAQQGAKKRR